MRPIRIALVATATLLVSACSSSATPATTAPSPAPAPIANGAHEAAVNWHLLDPATEGVPGIGLLRAERELLSKIQPKRVVVVAVIDNGMDTTHAALRPHLWMNPKETANGRDDDGNGYVDDVRGWNWLGGKDGRNVKQDTYELTRVAMLCTRARDSVPVQYRAKCPEIQS